jgi:hypothetical protein
MRFASLALDFWIWLLADSEVRDSKYWKLILVKNGKAVGDTI